MAFASRYAQAFLDVVTERKLDTVALDAQLSDFEATYAASPELQSFFNNPAIPAAQKVEFLDKLNAKFGLTKELRNLLAVLINNGRIGLVREVAAAYRTLLNERLGIRQAQIVTARALGAEEKQTLLEGVGKLAGARVQATFTEDATILGGAVVRIGSTVYDGSVRGRLERLKEALVAG